jgi:anthranilate synthase component 1
MSPAQATSVTPLPQQGGAPIEPDFSIFARLYDAGTPQVAWTRLVADLETPVSAMLKIAHGRPNSFLLESVEGGAVRGRYSIIGCEPDLIWRANGARAEVNRAPQADPTAFALSPQPALQSLRALLAESAIALPPALPPMAAGIFGYMGYDTVRLIEHLPATKPDSLHLPDSILVRPTLIVIFDAVKDEMTVVTPVRPTPGVSAKVAYSRAADRLNIVIERLDQPLPHVSDLEAEAAHPELKPSMTPAAYMEKVARAKEYIAAGDVMQVQIGQRIQKPYADSPLSLYRALRTLNPSPYMYFYNFGSFHVVGASPEILVRSEDRQGKRMVAIRPIAGTRPRGATPEQDAVLAAELAADPKERAEHLMLIDLARNDIGRIAKTGTVRVTEQYVVEKYSHVQHLVSHVEGELKPGMTNFDVLRATFPAGTLSGAPKVRAMEIIDELEPVKRGIYGGAAGYLSFAGDMDLAIVIRTAIVKDNMLYAQAAAGIVADSVAESEWKETEVKARAVLRAAEQVEDGFDAE